MGYGTLAGIPVAAKAPRKNNRNSFASILPVTHVYEITSNPVERTVLLRKRRVIRKPQTSDLINCRTLGLLLILIGGLFIGIHLLMLETSEWPANYPFNFIARELWYTGEPIEKCNLTTLDGALVSNVVLLHTRGDYCYDVITCLRIISRMGNQNISQVPHNFLIGGDGKTYELRGWDYMSGFEQLPMNERSLTVGLMGDFTTKQPTSDQHNEIKALISESIRTGNLNPDYKIHGAGFMGNDGREMFELFEDSLDNWVGLMRIF